MYSQAVGRQAVLSSQHVISVCGVPRTCPASFLLSRLFVHHAANQIMKQADFKKTSGKPVDFYVVLLLFLWEKGVAD